MALPMALGKASVGVSAGSNTDANREQSALVVALRSNHQPAPQPLPQSEYTAEDATSPSEQEVHDRHFAVGAGPSSTAADKNQIPISAGNGRGKRLTALQFRAAEREKVTPAMRRVKHSSEPDCLHLSRSAVQS